MRTRAPDQVHTSSVEEQMPGEFQLRRHPWWYYTCSCGVNGRPADTVLTAAAGEARHHEAVRAKHGLPFEATKAA